MKSIKLLLLGTTLLFTSIANAQNCCKRPLKMDVLASTADFKAAHESPIPYIYASENGSMQQFATTSGADGSVFFLPSKKPTNKVLIVFHEWWGLNDYIKKEAESLQKQLGDVNVYALDLYDGKVASEPDEAGKLMGGLSPERGKALIQGLFAKIGKDKKIATIGWCMGGSWSFTGTVLAGSQAVGSVMYYGFPDEDESHIKPLKADVLYIYGSQDKFITKANVDKFGKRVKTTKHNFTFHSFDATHAFANPSNPKYNAKAASEANVLAVKFLKTKLGL